MQTNPCSSRTNTQKRAREIAALCAGPTRKLDAEVFTPTVHFPRFQDYNGRGEYCGNDFLFFFSPDFHVAYLLGPSRTSRALICVCSYIGPQFSLFVLITQIEISRSHQRPVPLCCVSLPPAAVPCIPPHPPPPSTLFPLLSWLC